MRRQGGTAHDEWNADQGQPATAVADGGGLGVDGACNVGETATDQAHLEGLQLAGVDGASRCPAAMGDNVQDVCESGVTAAKQAAVIAETDFREDVTGRGCSRWWLGSAVRSQVRLKFTH